MIVQRHFIKMMEQALSFKTATKKQLIIVGLLLGLLFIMSFMATAYADGWGGFISEKLIERQGVTNSSLLVGTTSSSASYLDVVMGPKIVTGSTTNIYLDGTGTHATLQGSLTSLNGFPTSTVYFQWGYDLTYGNTTPAQVGATTGTYTAAIQHYDATRTVHYRIVGKTDGTNYGNDALFLFSGAGGPEAGIPMLPIIPIAFIGFILLSMLVAWQMRLNPILILIIVATEIYIGIAFLTQIQALINSLW